MKDWEIIADNLSKAGWSWGCVSAIDSEGRTIWIADAHRDNGKRFVVRADEKLTAFLELEAAIRLLVSENALTTEIRHCPLVSSTACSLFVAFADAMRRPHLADQPRCHKSGNQDGQRTEHDEPER